MRMIGRAAALALSAALVAGCGGGDAGNQVAANGSGSAAAPAAGGQPLAAVLAEADEARRIGAIARNSGLESVLSGIGPYTLLAPSDAAVERLGVERADALAGESMRAPAAALMRAHILPGALTRADLEAAIERAQGGRATMRTMAGGNVTFSRDGDAIVVEGEGGARARLMGEVRPASNGTLIPVDGLLVPVS